MGELYQRLAGAGQGDFFEICNYSACKPSSLFRRDKSLPQFMEVE
ncbi:MAG: hypothetical protein AB1846_00630 [Chloroflexota bacterium]